MKYNKMLLEGITILTCFRNTVGGTAATFMYRNRQKNNVVNIRMCFMFAIVAPTNYIYRFCI